MANKKMDDISGKKFNKLLVLEKISRHDTGYTLNNVVPCCKPCNFAKWNRTYEEFNEWLEKILKFRNSK